tara:strand:+ start:1151 stop:1426 length:276 start_codon:yes stop_codon:yes gene_type:complete
MLLGWNGNVVWETDLDYLGVDGENEADVLESIQVATGCSAANGGFITNGPLNSNNMVNESVSDSTDDYWELRRKLIANYFAFFLISLLLKM